MTFPKCGGLMSLMARVLNPVDCMHQVKKMAYLHSLKLTVRHWAWEFLEDDRKLLLGFLGQFSGAMFAVCFRIESYNQSLPAKKELPKPSQEQKFGRLNGFFLGDSEVGVTWVAFFGAFGSQTVYKVGPWKTPVNGGFQWNSSQL